MPVVALCEARLKQYAKFFFGKMTPFVYSAIRLLREEDILAD